jgi:hypothetical protein
MNDTKYQAQLMEVPQTSEGIELSTQLSLVLTRSSLAHQYALISLSESADFNNKEENISKLEEAKRQYFTARELLSEINPEKLFAIETEIRIQKEVVFAEKVLLH